MRNFDKLINFIDSKLPFDLQENWDRSGIWYHPVKDIESLGVSLEIEDFSVEEIRSIDAFLVHHPPFLTDESEMSLKQVEALEAVKEYKKGLVVCHTNADLAPESFTDYILIKAGISEKKPIMRTHLEKFKIVTYLPEESVSEFLRKLKENSFGRIGFYEACAFLVEGLGHFCAPENTKPYSGVAGECNLVKEFRVEFEISKSELEKALDILETFHPYEEPVIEIYEFKRFVKGNGYGRMFNCEWSVQELAEVLSSLKIDVLSLHGKHSKSGLVAFLPGSGRKLIKDVLKYPVSTFITSDLGYHEKKFLEQQDISYIEVSHDSIESWFVDWILEELGKHYQNLKIITKRRRYG